jgi:hypothetical protein
MYSAIRDRQQVQATVEPSSWRMGGKEEWLFERGLFNISSNSCDAWLKVFSSFLVRLHDASPSLWEWVEIWVMNERKNVRTFLYVTGPEPVSRSTALKVPREQRTAVADRKLLVRGLQVPGQSGLPYNRFHESEGIK